MTNTYKHQNPFNSNYTTYNSQKINNLINQTTNDNCNKIDFNK